MSSTPDVRIIAGPLGFYGMAFDGLFFGPLRQTKEDARDDAIRAADQIERCPMIAPHVWRDVLQAPLFLARDRVTHSVSKTGSKTRPKFATEFA